MIYETYPCPICGHKVALIGKDRDGRFYVECTGCGLRTEGQDSVRDALNRWNDRRYGEWRNCKRCAWRKMATWNPDGKYTVSCSRCQKVLAEKFASQYEYCPFCGAKINKEYFGVKDAEEEEILSRE